ncbi:MAG TPA: GNAT family N-acetyltransferase [Coriobacteriia bacterium]|nr:GNAT family N-acetyltransferase [Coriobacteriia bacterium]
MSEFNTREGGAEDLEGVLGVQHRAFGRVALMYGIQPSDLPPLNESIEDLGRLFENGTRFFVCENHEGSIVGSVRAFEADGVVEIGRLVVDDGWQRRGVASALMDLLEECYSAARGFELFTGAEADVPLALYEKRGYVRSRSDEVNGVRLVWLQKPGPGAVS